MKRWRPDLEDVDVGNIDKCCYCSVVKKTYSGDQSEILSSIVFFSGYLIVFFSINLLHS